MPRQTSVNLTPATDEQVAALSEKFGGFTDIVRIAIDRMYRAEMNGGKVLDFYPIEPPMWDAVKDLHPADLYHLKEAAYLYELVLMAGRLEHAGFQTQTGYGDSRFNLILVYAPDGCNLRNEFASLGEAQRLLDTVRNLPPAEAYARWLPKVAPLAQEPYNEDIARQDAREARKRLQQQYQAGEIDAEMLRLGWKATRP